jgi:hypothetical protein
MFVGGFLKKKNFSFPNILWRIKDKIFYFISPEGGTIPDFLIKNTSTLLFKLEGCRNLVLKRIKEKIFNFIIRWGLSRKKTV